MPDRRRGLCAVAVLFAVAASAAYLSPTPYAGVPVLPVPGDGGAIGSLLLLLPLYGALRFVARFGRAAGVRAERPTRRGP